jgi:hypothetical protein
VGQYQDPEGPVLFETSVSHLLKKKKKELDLPQGSLQTELDVTLSCGLALQEALHLSAVLSMVRPLFSRCAGHKDFTLFSSVECKVTPSCCRLVWSLIGRVPSSLCPHEVTKKLQTVKSYKSYKQSGPGMRWKQRASSSFQVLLKLMLTYGKG